jgi:hypothetical protein
MLSRCQGIILLFKFETFKPGARHSVTVVTESLVDAVCKYLEKLLGGAGVRQGCINLWAFFDKTGREQNRIRTSI